MPRTTTTMSSPPIVGRALLDEVALGSLLPDPLAEPDRLQQADVGRHQDHDQRERQQQALDQLDGHRARLTELEPEAVDHAGRARCRAMP